MRGSVFRMVLRFSSSVAVSCRAPMCAGPLCAYGSATTSSDHSSRTLESQRKPVLLPACSRSPACEPPLHLLHPAPGRGTPSVRTRTRGNVSRSGRTTCDPVCRHPDAGRATRAATTAPAPTTGSRSRRHRAQKSDSDGMGRTGRRGGRPLPRPDSMSDSGQAVCGAGVNRG